MTPIGSRAGVVVANPTSNPECSEAARGLGEAGLLARYHVPVAMTAEQESRIERWLPARLGRPVLQELRRRTVPEGLDPGAVRRTATSADFARVTISRSPLPATWSLRAHELHAERFDRAVARRLRSTDGAYFGVLGASRRALQEARRLGVPSMLDVPVASAGWIRRIMREEASRVPDFAATLQGHDFRDAHVAAQQEELDLADRLLVLSAHERQALLEAGADPAKMVDTPLGVDTSLFRPRPRPEDDVFRIIFVGQITQRKGLSYLIEGFRQAAIPGAELLLVGSVIGTALPWRATPGIRHVPAVPRSRLPALYATADVYVLPSLVEGFPLTQMEAMAMGLPVIVSTHTSASDVVSDGVQGWIVPIRDPQSIAERLVALHRDPDLRGQMGRAARDRAEAFTWDRYRTRIADLTAETLASRRG